MTSRPTSRIADGLATGHHLIPMIRVRGGVNQLATHAPADESHRQDAATPVADATVPRPGPGERNHHDPTRIGHPVG
jgi:hypothetical protein